MTKGRQAEPKQQRRRYSAEFKVEAVRLMRERRAMGVTVAQVGEELGVRPDMLQRWARKLERDPGAQGPAGPEAELRRLERENAVLRQERDFLKKAAAFFAKESQ